MAEQLLAPTLIQQDDHGDLIFAGQTWEEHVQTWEEVQGSIAEHFWALGAIGDSLARSYGDSDIKKFGHEVGISHQRIYAIVKTYRGWRGKRRSPRLTFSHHEEALKAPDPVAALEAAEDENMSVRTLAAWAAERAGKAPPVFDPAPEGGGSIVIPQTGAELKAWMSRVRSHKCLVGVGCSGPVEFAHLEAVPSANFYGFLSRRQGLGMWPGVPLCREHHREGRDAIHEIGEAAFVEKHLGGYKRAFGWIIGQMAAFILELRQPQ